MVLASCAWIYACGSDDDNNNNNNNNQPQPNIDSGSDADAGMQPDADSGQDATPQAQNPIEGVAAATPVDALNNIGYVDGLVWANNSLYFTQPNLDTPVIVQFTPPDVTTEYVDVNQGQPLGITFDPHANNLLFAVSPVGSPGTLMRVDVGATPTPVTPTTLTPLQSPPWQSPNDVVVRPTDGMMYVTDPGYQASSSANGVYRVDPTTGVVTPVATFDGDNPNGIALSPDNGTLYVSLTEPQPPPDGAKTPSIVKFTVNEDGSTSDTPVKFVDIPPNDSLLDGLTVDTAGNLYVSTKAGVQVFAPDGTQWGTITVPAPATTVTNLAFGGGDSKTLYISTDTGVFTAPVNVAGVQK